MVANEEQMYLTCGSFDWYTRNVKLAFNVPKKLIWQINLMNRALCRCDDNEH